MAKYKLQEEEYPRIYVDIPGEEYETYDEAVAGGEKLFDEGKLEDFIVREIETGRGWELNGYRSVKQECPICGKPVRVRYMMRTTDCRGIPYRRVCPKCYEKVMFRGYDGEYYDESDEQIDADY